MFVTSGNPFEVFGYDLMHSEDAQRVLESPIQALKPKGYVLRIYNIALKYIMGLLIFIIIMLFC